MLFARHHARLKKPVSNQRLSAAKRALIRQQEKHPLFAEQIAKAQPTPAQRIEWAEQRNDDIHQASRDSSAKSWRKGRAMLFTLSAEDRKIFTDEWNDKVRRGRPAKPWYFCDNLMHWIRVRYPNYDFGGEIGTAKEWTERMTRHTQLLWEKRRCKLNGDDRQETLF